MLYTSTRDKNVRVTASQAISRGISSEGGLFVPEEIPKVSLDFIQSLASMDYKSRAKAVLSMYLSDFSADEIDSCVEGAYADGKFSSKKVAPLFYLSDQVSVLELWRGPTCAFKDMALQLLPYLLTVSAKKSAPGKTIVILVATSGDTGKAALEGFKDVPGTKILVFYPNDGVSAMQKLQMATQEGENVSVCAIEGNFDDAQNGVKAIFTDENVRSTLAAHDMMFSSANSINWGRLVPQIVYYFSAYADLLADGRIKIGDKINIVVPTGNFGNILASYYAMTMGLPINKLICASNANNVLTDFLQTGTYNKNRSFFTTASPSMDILISSNLERLLFHLTDDDDIATAEWMRQLKDEGKYTVTDDVKEKIMKMFSAGFCDDAGTVEEIARSYSNGYLPDTHTAVALKVTEDYLASSGDKTKTVVASTANPYKFPAAVYSAVCKEESPEDADEFRIIEMLIEHTGVECPPQLAGLKDKSVRFTTVSTKENMIDAVYDMLGLKEV